MFYGEIWSYTERIWHVYDTVYDRLRLYTESVTIDLGNINLLVKTKMKASTMMMILLVVVIGYLSCISIFISLFFVKTIDLQLKVIFTEAGAVAVTFLLVSRRKWMLHREREQANRRIREPVQENQYKLESI